MSNFFKRLITAVLSALLLYVVVMDNTIIFQLGIFFVIFLSVYEMERVIESKLSKNVLFLYVSEIVLGINFIFNLKMELYISVLTVLSFLFLYVLDERSNFNRLMSNIFVYTYIILNMNLLQYMKYKKEWIFLLCIGVFTSDIFAFIFGSILGRHKIAPNISPNKSLEGAIGGFLSSIIFMYVYFIYFLDSYNVFDFYPLMLVPVFSQFGDLLASKIKRNFKTKDFGYVLPGHGGILDRFDSFLLACPMFFLLLKFKGVI